MAPQSSLTDAATPSTPAPSSSRSADSDDGSPSVSKPAKPVLCRRPVRLGLYTALIIIVLLMLAWRYLPGLMDPTFEKHIENKQVIVGMTRQQVLKAWGGPYSMNVSYTKDGVRREEWIYEDWINAATVKHRYLYFEEDILVGGWYHQ